MHFVGTGSRVVIFTDSLVCLGAFSKGRSGSSALNRLCRKALSISIARDIKLSLFLCTFASELCRWPFSRSCVSLRGSGHVAEMSGRKPGRGGRRRKPGRGGRRSDEPPPLLSKRPHAGMAGFFTYGIFQITLLKYATLDLNTLILYTSTIQKFVDFAFPLYSQRESILEAMGSFFEV